MQNAFSGKSADDHQGLSGLNRGALRNRQLFHSAVAGGEDFILHLHRLKHQNALAGFHRVADRDKGLEDGTAHRSGDGAGAGTISAPMSGTILKALVAVGDAVKSGQCVLVLEAMKMENEIFAPCDGTVKELSVSQGAAVQPGQTLMVIG